MNEIEAAKRKIRKLLSLSKSDNENEASIAIEKCNELLKQFNLKEDDVLITSNDIKTTKKHSRWRYRKAKKCQITEYVDRNYTLEKCSVKTKKTLNNTAFKRGFIEGDHVSLQRQMVGSQIRQLEASL